MSASESETDQQASSSLVKRRKLNYLICGHCNKELREKKFKEHRKLYYDSVKKLWITEIEDNPSSSDFRSLDEFDLDEFNILDVEEKDDTSPSDESTTEPSIQPEWQESPATKRDKGSARVYHITTHGSTPVA